MVIANCTCTFSNRRDIKQPTVVPEGADVQGSIRSTGDVLISGKLKGELNASSLTIESTGSVQGQIKVERLVSHGEVTGEIDAKSVELHGNVGDHTVLRADSLQVTPGRPGEKSQVILGSCELHVGDQATRGGAKDSTERDQAPATHTVERP